MTETERIKNIIKSLLTDDVPYNTRRMVLDLNIEGKRAVSNYYDQNSDFHKHANLDENVHKFADSGEKSTPIFHYTTVSALKNILSSGFFRIKSSHYMNDPDEFKWASKVTMSYLEKLGASSQELKTFQDRIIHSPIHDSYIWSFSQNDDSETLFHVYGGDEGIALEFSEKDVMVKLALHNSHGKQDLSEFTSGDAYTSPLYVIYDAKEQSDFIEPIAREWLDAYRGLVNDSYDRQGIITLCEQNIALFDMAFKNPKLHQEEEFRFVSLRRNDGYVKPELIVNGVPFINFEFNPSYIKSITTSPTCSQAKKQLLKSLVNKYHINAEIKDSGLPY